MINLFKTQRVQTPTGAKKTLVSGTVKGSGVTPVGLTSQQQPAVCVTITGKNKQNRLLLLIKKTVLTVAKALNIFGEVVYLLINLFKKTDHNKSAPANLSKQANPARLEETPIPRPIEPVESQPAILRPQLVLVRPEEKPIPSPIKPAKYLPADLRTPAVIAKPKEKPWGPQVGFQLRQTLKLEQKQILEPPQVRGIEGTRRNLCKVLSEYPQISRNGRINYVLSGGWAVELWSGKQRPHKDIDIIVLNQKFDVETDNQRPESYFGQLAIPRQLFRRSCAVRIPTLLPICWKKGSSREGLPVWLDFFDPVGEVVLAIPEVLILGKLSGGRGGEEARDKDI